MNLSRQIAFDVLIAVESGAYAADMLNLRTASLEHRDAALASSIVLGVLRHRAGIDFVITTLSGRQAARLDAEVLTALRMGVYQLRYLDRIPAHAAVDASVELVKRARKRSAAGFVNAVLRKVNRAPLPWPDRATELSCPAWMLARWEAAFGQAAAHALAAAALETPPRYIHVPLAAAVPGSAQPTEVPGCYLLPPGEAAPFRLQDIGSQAIVPLLDLQAGHRFLDLCAAPGNKTAQALESKVRAVACDVSRKRLQPLQALDIPLVLLDAQRPLPFGPVFDRILLDAPCSGTGTLTHNPEIKWRLHPEEIERQAKRQAAILASALGALAPGGLLVYSTCSLELEENERVVESVAAGRVIRQLRRMPGRDPGDGFFAAVIN